MKIGGKERLIRIFSSCLLFQYAVKVNVAQTVTTLGGCCYWKCWINNNVGYNTLRLNIVLQIILNIYYWMLFWTYHNEYNPERITQCVITNNNPECNTVHVIWMSPMCSTEKSNISVGKICIRAFHDEQNLSSSSLHNIKSRSDILRASPSQGTEVMQWMVD